MNIETLHQYILQQSESNSRIVLLRDINILQWLMNDKSFLTKDINTAGMSKKKDNG
jgi:hypothetical protein